VGFVVLASSVDNEALRDEHLMKRFDVIVLAIAVAILVGGLAACAVWLSTEPWLDAPSVGATATFEESAKCLYRYGNALAGRDQGTRLDNGKVAACFPPQTEKSKAALISCFNTYERTHPGHDFSLHGSWPEDDMRGCTWDGRPAVPAHPFAFGRVVAVPPVPRAGKPFLLKVGVSGSDSSADEVSTALRSGALDVLVTTGGEHSPSVDIFLEFNRDGTIHMECTVPKNTGGAPLRIELVTATGKETLARKIVTFRIKP
jgi:hypothetical protein